GRRIRTKCHSITFNGYRCTGRSSDRSIRTKIANYIWRRKVMTERQKAGLLTEQHVGENVVLKGWVHRRRDLGELIFIDLRDASGIVQIVFNPNYSKEALAIAETLRSEYVIEIEGKVIKRDEETVNPNIATGTIEVTVANINILNKSKNLPFLIHEAQDVSEDLRLKHRYIDLRREDMQHTFRI